MRAEITFNGDATAAFFLAGRFQRLSIADRDANVQIVNTANNQVIGTTL